MLPFGLVTDLATDSRLIDVPEQGSSAGWMGKRKYGLAWWATWLFSAPFFFVGASVGTSTYAHLVYVQYVGFGVVIIAAALSVSNAPLYRGWSRAWAVITFFTVLTGVYLMFPRMVLFQYASQSHYLKAALVGVVSWALPGIFAALFYREALFVDVLWALIRGSVWVALGGYALSRVTGAVILVNAQPGNDRLQGLLSEPSAWAPIVAAGLLIALRRRSKLYVMLILLVAALTESPTVYIVAAISIPLYYVLTGAFKPKRLVLLLFLAMSIPLIVNFVQTANPNKYLNSSNHASVVVGRIISGVQDIESNGSSGTNTRFTSTTQTVNDTEANGLLDFGGGPGSAGLYFRAKYPISASQNAGLGPNALWVEFLFDFGMVGVAVLFVLLAAAVIRMRRVPVMAEILLPFIVASLINSAGGTALYQVAIMAIFLFAFGWGLPRNRPQSLSSCT